jgi:hypothetical protein
MLRELSERYARRAREFSDAVACHGYYPEVGPKLLELTQEITLRKNLCDAAGDDLDQYLEQATNPDQSHEVISVVVPQATG